ncbi:hypothetical protein J4216_01405 [Candidatus Woesearchaeota archaeon]|nr:hypothetical protein [Candidatus Woesearchaeota archaeon]
MVIDNKMTVMQVRPNYSIIYQFKPTLRIEKRHVKSQKDFVGYIKEISTNWKDGDYFLKTELGTFAYFTLNGNRVKLFKKSKIGKEYLCWQFFGPAYITSKIRNRATNSRAIAKTIVTNNNVSIRKTVKVYK